MRRAVLMLAPSPDASIEIPPTFRYFVSTQEFSTPRRQPRELPVECRLLHVDRPAAQQPAALADHNEHRRLVDRVGAPDGAVPVDPGRVRHAVRAEVPAEV